VVRGELDVASANWPKGVLEHTGALGPDELVFDMAAFFLMDSSGSAVRVHAANSVKTVVLRAPGDMVRGVIEITSLTSVFRIQP